jgi:hypothetical protein
LSKITIDNDKAPKLCIEVLVSKQSQSQVTQVQEATHQDSITYEACKDKDHNTGEAYREGEELDKPGNYQCNLLL